MEPSIFLAEGERFLPTDHARGPWDPAALHGGAPAALITAAFEATEPGSELPIGRLSFELLRPVPFAPLSISIEIVRPGRRVQELACELHAELPEGPQLICRAAALRLQPVPGSLPTRAPVERMPGPETGESVLFALDDPDRASFAGSAMEMRFLDDPRTLGPARVWMCMRHPLLPGRPPTPLARLAATSDFANGVSAVLPFGEFLFINADLHLHLHRPPRGEWIGLDARTLLHEGGMGLAESVLHDEEGAVGRAFQSLVVQPRPDPGSSATRSRSSSRSRP